MSPTRLLLVLFLVAALLPPAVSAATYVVAAADASVSDKAVSNLVCDGVDDQRDINNAFNSLPDDMGTVQADGRDVQLLGQRLPERELGV